MLSKTRVSIVILLSLRVLPGLAFPVPWGDWSFWERDVNINVNEGVSTIFSTLTSFITVPTVIPTTIVTTDAAGATVNETSTISTTIVFESTAVSTYVTTVSTTEVHTVNQTNIETDTTTAITTDTSTDVQVVKSTMFVTVPLPTTTVKDGEVKSTTVIQTHTTVVSNAAQAQAVASLQVSINVDVSNNVVPVLPAVVVTPVAQAGGQATSPAAAEATSSFNNGAYTPDNGETPTMVPHSGGGGGGNTGSSNSGGELSAAPVAGSASTATETQVSVAIPTIDVSNSAGADSNSSASANNSNTVNVSWVNEGDNKWIVIGIAAVVAGLLIIAMVIACFGSERKTDPEKTSQTAMIFPGVPAATAPASSIIKASLGRKKSQKYRAVRHRAAETESSDESLLSDPDRKYGSSGLGRRR